MGAAADGGGIKSGPTGNESLEVLFGELAPEVPKGPVRSAGRSLAIIRGAFLLYGTGQFDDAQDLVGLLGSNAALKDSFETIVRDYLRLPGFSLPADSLPGRQ